MPSDVDKTYVKKHRINDMLNELYTELTSQKPDNPVLFAFKHFEKKLPKDELESTDRRPQSSLLPVDILPLGRSSAGPSLAEDAAMPLAANALFSKLFNREVPSQTPNAGEASPGAVPGAGLFALSTFNIINKLTRINAKINNEMSMEEALEKENITYSKSKVEKTDDKPSKIAVSYKTELKTRENILRHKNEIRSLVADELRRQKNPFADKLSDEAWQQEGEMLDDDGRAILSRAMNDVPAFREEETEELNQEMLTSRMYHRGVNKDAAKKRNKFRKFNAFAAAAPGGGGLDAFAAGIDSLITPRVQLIICQVCSKIQSNPLEEKNDLMNRDFMSGVNQDTMPKTAPIASSKEPLRVEKTANAVAMADESNKTPIASNPFFMEFFKGALDPTKSNPNQQSDNLDDGPIESASQVSGPRHVEPFELPTDRNQHGKPQLNRRESGVLAWVMARQAYDEPDTPIPEKPEKKSPEREEQQNSSRREERPPPPTTPRAGSIASRAGSANKSATGGGSNVHAVAASPRSATGRGETTTPRRGSVERGSAVGGQQAWRVKETDSDVSSATLKPSSKNQKNS